MVPQSFADVAPWPDWCASAEGAMQFLADHVGWDVWMVTQVVDDRQVVLLAHPPAAVRPGMELPWEESFCRQMTEGRAPRLATVTAAVPAFASRTTVALRDVAAYVGVPLVRTDGTLFGTLCGVAFRAKPRSAAREMSVVEAAARMLSTLMAAGMEPPSLSVDPGS
jgi:GAF domain-containing protein